VILLAWLARLRDGCHRQSRPWPASDAAYRNLVQALTRLTHVEVAMDLKKRMTPIAVLVWALVGGACDASAEAPAIEVLLQTVLRSVELEPVRSPDKVESLAVESLPNYKDKTAVPMETTLPGQFRILPEAAGVPAPVAAELSRLLLSRASYSLDTKRCGFQPAIAFRFWKGDRAVDALVCFACDELAFQVVGSPKALGDKLSFDPVRADLVRLVRTARPADKRFEDLR
jgi:hypothetical protein